MIGRRAAVGVSLLCALVFCAFAAQSASAKGTTAFTCVRVEPKKGTFADAHCDTEQKEGEYIHEEIKPGVATEIDISNEKTSHETQVTTPAILRSTVAGITFEIQCTSTTGKYSIKNVEIEKTMQVEGNAVAGEMSNCTVIRPENAAEERHPCKVAGGKVELEANPVGITKETLGASKKEMGVELKPQAGKPFAKLEFEGANCNLKGTKIEITGTAIATGARGSSEATTSSGATFKLTTAMTAETLKVGASVAEASATSTPTMYNAGTGKTENPITLTTTAT